MDSPTQSATPGDSPKLPAGSIVENDKDGVAGGALHILNTGAKDGISQNGGSPILQESGLGQVIPNPATIFQAQCRNPATTFLDEQHSLPNDPGGRVGIPTPTRSILPPPQG